MRKGKTFAARFAGERIALYRGAGGAVYALEDRCAHRQVPLSMGVVEGDALRCCYHAWAYRGNGRISQIPYLPKDAPPAAARGPRLPGPRGVRPGIRLPRQPGPGGGAPLPDLPEFDSAEHKTMTFSRTVACHYSFMHENLLDMNHQFLHRGVVGRIQPELLGYQAGPRFVEARYLFTHAGGRSPWARPARRRRQPRGAGRHHHPHRLPVPDPAAVRPGPAARLSACGRSTCPRTPSSAPATPTGCSMIAKPPVPGALRLAWPLIRRFTERVFAEDRMAVEAEQRAWDEQGADRNHEVFPLILDVRDVLRSNGVAMRPEAGCPGRC